MRFCLRCLWSGGTAMGGVISIIGLAQWAYEAATRQQLEIYIPWYVMVIIGLVIIVISSLSKAYSLHHKEIAAVKEESEAVRREMAAKMRQLLKFPTSTSVEPLSVEVTVGVDARSLADIYPVMPKSKRNIMFQIGSMGVGVVHIQNNSHEPVEIEIEYEIVSGNVPILLQRRVDNIPIVFRPQISRSDIINPKERRDVAFVAYALVDRFHKGFKFPSYLASRDNRLLYRVEGRLPVFWIGAGKISVFPYIDMRLRVIAVSMNNTSKNTENVLEYRITANPRTSELSIAPNEVT